MRQSHYFRTIIVVRIGWFVDSNAYIKSHVKLILNLTIAFGNGKEKLLVLEQDKKVFQVFVAFKGNYRRALKYRAH